MPRLPFRSQEQVRELWSVFDKLAQKLWDNLPSDDEQRREIHSAAGQFHASMVRASRSLPSLPVGNLPSPPVGVNGEQPGWANFYTDLLADHLGLSGISSVFEAYLKANAMLRALQSTAPRSGGQFLYRGQRDIGWSLTPRKGRSLLESGWVPPEVAVDARRLTVTQPEELAALDDFRQSWPTSEIEAEDLARPLADDDPSWWFRMQHYDAGDGTRLLDVTTSLNAALLFACVDWTTGRVDAETDGVIYFWAEGTGGNIDDCLLRSLPASARGFFDGHPDAPRWILNPPVNERLRAQSGAFLWWPRFWEQPPNPPLYLRVNAGAKETIARELLSMGFGPKDAVRGMEGLRNERTLREQLGYPEWQPMVLQD